jgi:SAM-dependent methyltransferase
MSNSVQSSYDVIAGEYAKHYADELTRKPFDRKMLDWLIEKVGTLGGICDLGCGPGQIAAYLASRGTTVCGIDLSEEMVRTARRLNPGLLFEQGDMLDLRKVADAAFGGIAAFYSIIHIGRANVTDALRELHRILAPGGVLLITFHIGSEVIHRDEMWGRPVSLDFNFFERSEMKEFLSAAGFTLEEAMERDPYPGAEYESRRAYIFARKP